MFHRGITKFIKSYFKFKKKSILKTPFSLVSNFFHENTKKNQVVGSNGRGAGGNNGEWVRRDGKWVQLEEELDQRPILNV